MRFYDVILGVLIDEPKILLPPMRIPLFFINRFNLRVLTFLLQ